MTPRDHEMFVKGKDVNGCNDTNCADFVHENQDINIKFKEV